MQSQSSSPNVGFGSGCRGKVGWQPFGIEDASAVPSIFSVAQSVILPKGDLFCALDGGLDGAERPFPFCQVFPLAAGSSGPWTLKEARVDDRQVSEYLHHS